MIPFNIFPARLRARRNRKKTRDNRPRMHACLEVLESRMLFSATAGAWGPVLDWGLQAKHMVLLPTGDVLVWSTGQNASVWDSATGALTATPYFFGDLHCAAQVALADGRIAVFGGQDGEPHVGIEVTAMFDAFTNTWTSGTVMNFERWYATATTLSDGRVLVTSGDDHGEARVTIPEVYDPVTDSWTLLTGADRSQGLYPEMFVLPDGRVYEAGSKKDTWFLNLSGTGSWTEGPENSFGSSGYAESAVMYAPGKILRAGGGDPAFNNAAVIDTNTANPQWRDVESMEFDRRRMNLVILADGSVMALGGTGQADDVNQAVLAGEIWDPVTEQWTTVASMTEARMYHSSAVLLPDGRVLTGGGEASGRLHAQIYSPPYLFDGARPTITSSPTTAAYGTNFVLETPQAADITSVSLIRPGAPTHAFDHNQRYVPLSYTLEGNHLRVTAPVDGNTAPPGYYMLIIENGAGTPSVAAWIKINSSDNLAPGTITGRVTNAVTGAGVAGATVSYNFGSVTTTSNGNYTLTQVPPGEHLVTVSAPGFATYTQSQQVNPNQTATLNIALVAPAQISGVVTSLQTGNPIAGAKISYSGGSVIADANGHYVAPEIPSGIQTVIASKVGFNNVQHTVTLAPNGSLVVNFALPTALTAVEGEVRDLETGAPIEGAIVMLETVMTTTNASGFYIFSDVAPGQYHVSVSAVHYVGMTQHALVESGFTTTADFNLALKPLTTTTHAPTDDSLVKISNPTKNYGQQDHLRLRAGTDTYRSYLKFNVGDLEGPIHKATLRLWSFDGSDSTASIHAVSNNLNGSSTSWTENNITWNNAPLIAGTPLSSVIGSGTGAFVDFDVTQAITGSGIFSFGLQNTNSDSMYFYSTEGLTPPQLIIESFMPEDESPRINHFSPESGGPGTVVSIHGMNLSGVTSVLFNGVPSTQVGFVSDMEVRALVPPGVTTGPITLTTAAGTAISDENFTVVSEPPLITTTASSLPYIENAPAVEIDPGLLTSDPDSTNFVGAIVAITSGFGTGQDVLAFENQLGITGSYNAATGVLTLTGTSSVANYQSALRKITYGNTSDNPSTANRVVTFSVNDGGQSVSATRTVTVAPVNDPPVAVANSYTMTSGGTLTTTDTTGSTGSTNDDSVLRNDTDPENNPLTATKIADPTHGTLTLNSNGTFTYVHNGDSATSDSFTYQASDGTNPSNVVTVTIAINPPSSTPVTVSFQNDAGGAYIGTVDSRVRSDKPNNNYGELTPLELHGSAHGGKTAFIRWNVGSIPTDAVVQSATITVNVTNLSNQTFNIHGLLRDWIEGQVTWNQASQGVNWTTPGGDRDATVLGTITAPTTGLRTITLNPAGISLVQSWINNPATNRGLAFLNYAVTDGLDFDSSEATIATNRPKLTITYTSGGSPVNNPPTANNNTYTVTQGATLSANDTTGSTGSTNDDSVLRNDTDPENNPLSAILVSGPTHATSFTLNPNGTFNYVHNGDTATSDTFTYRAFDGTNESGIATATITITPGGGTPVTTTFRDGVNGYAGTSDATIRSDNPTANSGSVTVLETDGSPDLGTLLRWNISSIPVGSTVQSASITLFATNASDQAYEIYQVLRPWVESQVTWNQAASGTNWTTGGAQGSGDRGTTALASITPSSTGVRTINLNAAGLAIVQSWINDPSSNNGVIIQDYANSNGFDINSREFATVTQRPMLTVTYATSGSPLVTIADAPANTSNTSIKAVAITNSSPSSVNRALDVSQDGTVSALDALIVINEINSHGSRVVNQLSSASNELLDSNRDGTVSALDALIIINHLNARSVQAASTVAKLNSASSVHEGIAFALNSVEATPDNPGPSSSILTRNAIDSALAAIATEDSEGSTLRRVPDPLISSTTSASTFDSSEEDSILNATDEALATGQLFDSWCIGQE